MRQETVDGRQETGDRRWDTGDSRHQAVDRRRETRGGRQETAVRRWETADRSRKIGEGRQEKEYGREEMEEGSMTYSVAEPQPGHFGRSQSRCEGPAPTPPSPCIKVILNYILVVHSNIDGLAGLAP